MDPPPFPSRWVRSKQNAKGPTQGRANRSINVHKVGLASIHRQWHARRVIKEKAVRLGLPQKVADRVPKASLVKQKDRMNVRFVPAIGFNHKMTAKVWLV
jgi:hypothetical protein